MFEQCRFTPVCSVYRQFNRLVEKGGIFMAIRVFDHSYTFPDTFSFSIICLELKIIAQIGVRMGLAARWEDEGTRLPIF